MNVALPSSPAYTSVHDYLDRVSGDIVTKVATLSANNTTASVALFTLTGAVMVRKIWGVLTAKTTLANCTNLHLDLYDATDALPITKTTTITLSGLAIGTMVVKTETLATALTLLNNVAGCVAEGSTAKGNFEFIINKKTAATTQIRMTYTTTDAPANAQITWFCEFYPMSAGSSLVAA